MMRQLLSPIWKLLFRFDRLILGYRIILGYRGESAACAYLRRACYVILKRNWRCADGEIDIIAVAERTLIFVEVKSARSAAFRPIDSVDAAKMRRLRRLAETYIHFHRRRLRALRIKSYRFDIITVTFRGVAYQRRLRPTLRHFENAFDWR